MTREPNDIDHSEPTDPAVSFAPVSFFPDSVNHFLANFFEANSARGRLYVLLLSLWRHQSVRTANAMAFDLFLALVPMLGVAGWGASLLLRNVPAGSRATVLPTLAPADLNQFLGEHFEALAATHLAPLAAVVGWWLSSSAFHTMIGVFEETFECEERSWLRRRLVSLGLALVGMVFLGVSGILGVVLAVAPGVVNSLVHILDATGAFRAALGVSAYLGMTAFLAVLYRYTVHRPGKVRRVWAGAFTASTIGAAASLALGYYAAHIARYALFYGGLAVIVVVLVWLWLWSTAILVGAELNVALEDVRSPVRDSPEHTQLETPL